jgi:predicted patatin/cPLA2 family phospholipase
VERYGLVLEGGGVRGAFTAGALAWLNDQGIRFDYGVGISSGAVYLCCYWEGDTHTPHNMAVKYAGDKENVGLQAFRKEGYYVAYEHIFRDDLLAKEHMSVASLRESGANIEVGAYDLNQGKTVWYGAEALDDELTLLRGCCALPIASAIVDYGGTRLLDGGITKMIPIERSIMQGCTRHLIITTKPADYVRKPAPGIIRFLMKRCYPKYPQVYRDYCVRHINYYKQIGIIDMLVEEGKGLLIYPTVTIPVSRFKGDPENCEKLYALGYQDMETRKQEILKFLGRESSAESKKED